MTLSAASRASATERAIAAFRARFGRDPDGVARAPGRVNLIGEHTDYNDGFVLPLAIDRDIVVAFAAAPGEAITALACDAADAEDRFDAGAPYFDPTIRGPEYPEADRDETLEWSRYVRATARALVDDGLTLRGADLAIAGDVPLGSGLSSSAAMEMAVGRALLHVAGVDIDPTRLAAAGQRAENAYVGCACGIMDQLISARGRAGHALMIDCRSLETRAVPLPPGSSVVVVHSGVRHAHAGGAYNDRREQCEAAARHHGVPALRDLDADALAAGRAGLDAVAHARAEHVVTENSRVEHAARALAAGDLRTMGVLMRASHASMRDQFAITTPDVDRLQAVMDGALDGVGGARMTGGGFGGCVIALTEDARVPALLAAVEAGYRAPDGSVAETFVVRASDGASVSLL